MYSKKRTPVDPTYFCQIYDETADYNEDEMYSKGKHHNQKEKHQNYSDDDESQYIRYKGKNTLVIIGRNGDSDIHINLKDTREYVKELRDNYAEMMISQLEGRGKEAYEAVYNLVQALKKTPAYKPIYKIIQEEFQCVQDHHYKLGTIGAYFCECKNADDFPGNPNCSLGCLFGLNLCGEKHPPCEYTCLVYIGDGTISLLQKVESSSDEAYLFVNENTKFIGLKDVEIDQLKLLKIGKVKVVQHKNGSDYKEITKDFIPIHKLHSPPSSSGQSNAIVNRKKSKITRFSDLAYINRHSNHGLTIVIVILIFILVLLIVGYVHAKYTGKDYIGYSFLSLNRY